jgi:hypothetical protein
MGPGFESQRDHKQVEEHSGSTAALFTLHDKSMFARVVKLVDTYV